MTDYSEHSDPVREALDHGEIVGIIFDPALDDVIIPDQYRQQQGVLIDMSYSFNAPPIPELYVDCDGISGYFSFIGVQSFVYIPWLAVYQVRYYSQPIDVVKAAPRPKPKRALPVGWRVIIGGSDGGAAA